MKSNTASVKALEDGKLGLASKLAILMACDREAEIISTYACAQAAELLKLGPLRYGEVPVTAGIIARKAISIAVEKTGIKLTKAVREELTDTLQTAIIRFCEIALTPYEASMLSGNYNYEHELIKMELLFGHNPTDDYAGKYVLEKVRRLIKRVPVTLDPMRQRVFNQKIKDGIEHGKSD